MKLREIEAYAKALIPVIRNHVSELVDPITRRIEAIESMTPIKGEPGAQGEKGAAGEKGEPGETGPQGERGKDGLDGAPGKDGVDGLPGKDGLDGLPGKDGLDGAPGKDGLDGAAGKDGRDADDQAIYEQLKSDMTEYHKNQFHSWVLEYEREANRRIEKFIESIPTPKDGKDGVSFDKWDFRFDGRDVVLSLDGEDRRAKHDLPLYRGVWRDGDFEKGDFVSFGGSVWHCNKDTAAKPGTNDDWTLAVKRGRDGAR